MGFQGPRFGCASVGQQMTERREHIEALVHYCFVRGGSGGRLHHMLDVLERQDEETFWRVYFDVWNSCDDTWWDRKRLLRLLRRNIIEYHFECFLNPDALTFYQSLPEKIIVYRGCSRRRKRGLSWTTDVEVARGFARGHRGISVPHAAVFRARIHKGCLLGVFVDRKESEVIVDPACLTNVREMSPRGWR